MNAKKVLAVFMCMLTLTLITLAAGAMNTPTNDPQTTDIGYTFVRGFITKPQLADGGHSISFRCIYVHYMYRGFGEKQFGILHMFQKIVVDNQFAGYIGNHYIFARFDGQLDF